MSEIQLKSYGKINLGLDVLYKRQDDYHEILTIMQEIDLFDTVKIKDRKDGFVLETNIENLPVDTTNLVYKSWDKICKKMNLKKGVEITIEKNIPIGGGLAGGSSNAASVLKGLNELWDLGLSIDDLKALGLTIGADVPFCLQGGTALAGGIGEDLSKLDSFKDVGLILVNPGISILTEEIYKNLDLVDHKPMDIEKLIKFMIEDDLVGLSQNMENIMEKYVIGRYPVIGQIKTDLVASGALGALMSGSGATVFGIFDDKEKIRFAYEKLKEKYPIVIISKTI